MSTGKGGEKAAHSLYDCLRNFDDVPQSKQMLQHLHMHRVFPIYIAAKNPTQLAAISFRSNCNLLTTHTHSGVGGEKGSPSRLSLGVILP